MRLLEEIKSTDSGRALLLDWLGDGGFPVDQTKADIRAHTCSSGNLGKSCLYNKEPNWWERVKNSIAATIKRQLELRHRMKLKALDDDSIHMCSKCGCCLKLKVWTPIQHIATHTSTETLNSLPSFCWMRHEIADTYGR